MLFLKFMWKGKASIIDKVFLKKNKIGRLILLDFTYPKLQWLRKCNTGERSHTQLNGTKRETRNRLTTIWPVDLWQKCKDISMEERLLFQEMFLKQLDILMQKKKMLTPWKKSNDKPRQCIKKQRHHFANESPYSQSYGFSSSHVWMWELDHKEGWAQKNWCFWIVVLEKTLESPLDYKEIQPVHLKGDQSWVFIGRTDAVAETPILWPPDEKNWLSGKDPDTGKDWGQEEKGTTEDEMVGWRHRLNGHEFEQLQQIVKDRGA